jgi:hypothetical protein
MAERIGCGFAGDTERVLDLHLRQWQVRGAKRELPRMPSYVARSGKIQFRPSVTKAPVDSIRGGYEFSHADGIIRYI